MAFVEIDQRTLGWLGMSIGTSLAFESVLNVGEFEKNEKLAPVTAMESIFANLRTLIRNAHDAFERDKQEHLTGKDLSEAVAVDWEGIKSSIAEVNATCDTVLYLCTYEGINEAYPDVKFRNSTTPKQLAYEALEKDTINYFQEHYKDELTLFKLEPEGKKRCVMLTHLPLDLLSFHKFPELTLLESYTGKLKPRRLWYTKLNVKKSDPLIPFTKSMLLIFGDSNMFSAQDMKARKSLFKISEKGRWHALTTHAKIEQDIRLAHEPFLLEFVHKYK